MNAANDHVREAVGRDGRPRILIAGGGYVGMYTALGLERLLDAEEAELYMVAPENFMRYQPLLPEVAAGSVEPRHVVVPLRRVLPRTRVTLGRLSGLDHGRRTATITLGDGGHGTIGYDVLVLGLGSVTKVMPVPGLVDHAVGFQTLAEAIHLRNQVLARLEVAESTTDQRVRRRALTFVFVGGGYAGVEALAELQDLARQACSSYRTIAAHDLRWILIEATDRILPSVDARLATHASQVLRARGIELRLETQTTSVEDGTVVLSDGERIEADTLVWMPGVAPNPVAAKLGLACDDRGRLIADECLRVDGDDAVWTAGDCAAIPDGHGGLHPPTAQHAEREAHHLARNIAAVLHGQPPTPFRYRTRGEFVTLGDRKAVARIYKAQLHGWPAWLARRAYYVARMPTAERRIRLVLDWAAGLPFKRDVSQLGSEQQPDRPLAEAAQEAA